MIDVSKYSSCWIQYYDEVIVDSEHQVRELDEERLIEARFTDGNEELHLWKDVSGEIKSAVTEISEGIDREYELLPKFDGSLSLRDIVDYDDDGQIYVKSTVLIKVLRRGSDEV